MVAMGGRVLGDDWLDEMRQSWLRRERWQRIVVWVGVFGFIMAVLTWGVYWLGVLTGYWLEAPLFGGSL